MSAGEKGVVAAGHPLTAQAGARVLREGGNAVDAAVGAMLTSFAAEPLLTGLGAGGHMLVAGGGEEPAVLDFFVEAPRLRRDGGAAELEAIDVSFGDAVQVFYIGPASCGIYGTPAGVCAAVERWGTIPLAQLAAPAARLAREGVTLNASQAYVAEILADLLTSTPECASLWAPEGRVLREGELIRNPELGDALDRLGSDGAEPFYRGDIARAVCDWLGERGGSLGAAELASYRAIEREPVSVSYRDRTVLTNPPPSAGGTLLAYSLALLDRGPQPPPLEGVLAAMEAAQAERTPEFTGGLAQDGFLERFLAAKLGSTTHISVLDSHGRACSVTCTNGEGSGVVVPGTGIHVNNVMGEEDLNPLGFHRHPAGRRMPSMMAPSVVLRADRRSRRSPIGGEVELVLGSAGSNRIRSAILQTIAGVVDHGLDVHEAVYAPRVHVEGGIVYHEPGIDVSAVRAAQPEREVVSFHAPNLFFGGVQAVHSTGGQLTGAGDPRRGGVAVSA
ncbi:MAG TPA: gamma-glutamyltransferase [Solirubrobacteraceae bacterium]|jgi:gamma-glutamyltranspeptidase/glutathione hydrolase|nr:gamma-glutamyltransferase [Solirubrobacteraceae bacterium]